MKSRLPRPALCTAAVLGMIALGMLLLNTATPLQLDDYDYSISWATGKPLTGIADVLASQAAHYRLWGGRSVVHTFTQMNLLLGKPLFNAVNTAVYLLFLLEVAALAGVKKERWTVIALMHAALFFGCPFFGTVFLWLDGACNYLWGTALALFPLLADERIRRGSVPRQEGALIVFLCFLAGWTNENTALGILAARIIWYALHSSTAGNRRLWRMTLIFQAAGAAVMLLAPGNFARASLGAGEGLLRRALVTLCFVALYAVIPIAAMGWMAVRSRKARASLLDGRAVELALAGLLSGLALAPLPAFSPRALTGMVTLLAAAAFAAAHETGWFACGRLRSCAAAAACAALGAASLALVPAVRSLRTYDAQWTAQLEAIQSAAREGRQQAYVQDVPAASRFTPGISFSDTADGWPNSTLSAIYGVEVIKKAE